MEIQKRLSACWNSFLACFKKPTQSEGNEEQRATVLANVGAITEPNPRATNPPAPVATSGQFYVALYDYSARTEEDLSFNAGDRLEALDKSNRDWWYAQAVSGVSANKEGYIPANYVAPMESIDAEPWVFPFGLMSQYQALFSRLLINWKQTLSENTYNKKGGSYNKRAKI